MKYFYLIIFWIAWCTLHSAMISISVTGYLKIKLGDDYRFYRLIFNIIALLTFIPIAFYGYSIHEIAIFTWNGFFNILRFIFITLAALLFYAGARQYDILQFTGIRQAQSGNSSGRMMSESGNMNISGVLGITRHPWYLGAIIIIWSAAGTLYLSTLITNIVLTIYLIVGANLEEKKLIKEIGIPYEKYRKKVSMLFPYRYLLNRFRSKKKHP
ncbi:MAG: hypothetical protein K9L30_06020 [Desulfobacterales bacterium]|nr:hypothetical protein [Desulfobacterales bacterium]